ncbi:alpha/beta hydrolase [Acuticoccus sp.]|uniref:alpha/beta hydrolase n=1 Tax=Acuticoccus sp. TaxID=1904378 RepID=UPI003B527710
MTDTSTRIALSDGELAVAVTEGRDPAVLWLGGFRSDMAGGKAVRLAEWGAAAGRRVVRFDYRGHGASTGAFGDHALSDWLADAEAVAERWCQGPTVAVGSSMGGWIALLMARRRLAAGRPFAGLVLVAPAADFTERLMWPSLSEEVRQRIMDEGVAYLPSAYGEPVPVTRRLFEDGRRHLVYGDAPIETGCPVHILQGVQDMDVPHTHALELVDRLAHDDVVLTLVKDGDHRLSREEDLERLVAAVEGITG